MTALIPGFAFEMFKIPTYIFFEPTLVSNWKEAFIRFIRGYI